MVNFFKVVFYQPILSVLIFIYNRVAFHDLGLSIVFLTIFIRIVLFPLFYKSAKDQALMRKLEPEIKRIQKEHKADKNKQAQELMALYKNHKFNPFSGIFLLILQLPVFIALFQLFSKEITISAFDNHTFLSLINLEEKSLVVAFVAGILQYIQGKISLPKDGKSAAPSQNPLASSMKMMVYIGPIFTVGILTGLPSAIGIYWIVSTFFSIGQQIYINKKISAR